MKVIVPVRITDARLLSSNLPENDYPEWDAATACTTGDRVIVAAQHSIYEAIKDSTGEPPDTSPTAWLRAGPTNRWAMFDESPSTVSRGAGQAIAVELAPGAVSAVAIINAAADSVRIEMVDPEEGTVFDHTYSMERSGGITNWWEYFFAEVAKRKTLIVDSLPTFPRSMLRITASGEAASIGALICGRMQTFAAGVEVGAQIGIDDYSTKERDEFGNLKIIERAFSQRACWKFRIPNAAVDSLFNTLSDLRATPSVYIGTKHMEAMTIYGFFRDFSINVQYPTYSDVSIQIEGLT